MSLTVATALASMDGLASATRVARCLVRFEAQRGQSRIRSRPDPWLTLHPSPAAVRIRCALDVHNGSPVAAFEPEDPRERGLESAVALAPQRERLVLDHGPEPWYELVLAGGRRVRQEDLEAASVGVLATLAGAAAPASASPPSTVTVRASAS